MEAIISDQQTILVIKCKLCDETHKLEVQTSDWIKYRDGVELIQNAFHYLSAGERELILSGICDTCFNDIMKDNEEDEEHQDDADELLGLIYSKKQ
jgi:hypothetical protein